MAMLYRRENSKFWWVKYYINSIPHYASTKCIKKFDAEIVMKAKYYPLETNSYNKMSVLPIKKPLFECLSEYREFLKQSHDPTKRKAASTINRQQRNLDNFKEYLKEKNYTEFSEISEDTIRDYVQAYLIIAKKKMPNTVYKDVQIVQNFFKWAMNKAYINIDPTTIIKNKKPKPSNPDYFSHEQVSDILDNAIEPYRSMFKLLYLTGMRIQELLNTEWQDIDLNQKKINVRLRDGNKAKRDTTVYLNVSAIEIIKKMEQEKGENKYLFTNQLGNQYAQGKINSYAVRLYKKLNIPTGSPLHRWRHSTASHLAISGVSLYIIKDILRHRSIKETEIYAHLSQECVQNAIERLSL